MKANILFLFSCCVVGLSEADQCLSGWTRHGERCYHFSHDTEQWMVAQLVCEHLGGYLVEIGSDAENSFIVNEVNRLKGTWIGANDLQVEGEWMWDNSKTKLAYTNWYPGEPTNAGGDENCVEIRPALSWNDKRCDVSLHYICEADPSEGVIVG